MESVEKFWRSKLISNSLEEWTLNNFFKIFVGAFLKESLEEFFEKILEEILKQKNSGRIADWFVRGILEKTAVGILEAFPVAIGGLREVILGEIAEKISSCNFSKSSRLNIFKGSWKKKCLIICMEKQEFPRNLSEKSLEELLVKFLGELQEKYFLDLIKSYVLTGHRFQ